MKLVQEQYIASAEYDLQFEFTADTEDVDGTCKSCHTKIDYWIVLRRQNTVTFSKTPCRMKTPRVR